MRPFDADGALDRFFNQPDDMDDQRILPNPSTDTTPPRKAALLIIDVQEDFCPPNGSLAVKDGRKIAPIINELLGYLGFVLKIATVDSHPVNHISFAPLHPGAIPFRTEYTIKNPENGNETQTTVLWPVHCVTGTPGSKLINEVQWGEINRLIEKGNDARVEAYSAFGPPFRHPMVSMSDLDQKLKEARITDVFVVGLAYDYCVKDTALDAVELGYKTYVVQEGTKAVFQAPATLAATKKKLEEAGVSVISLDDPLLEALK
ncbi:Nicotinamidase [Fulvia fulva]|uniref:nicotinamidase n=1 Tax=Passalora fulva TaxID=5499 RepID=A0A9Q8LFA3_PASFU|nr:Nicotinamidase [Fulvia fulva]KAK4627742.1 Nicotinamidase [Fulvia fulva]UJO16491.1 Nicotinamidase [Fulvia fulva]